MKESRRNMLVGVFVMASVGALSVLMVWFGEAPTWLRTTDWDLRIVGVRDLRGVAEGSSVKLNGVEIGRVKGLDFQDRDAPEKGVVIKARISNDFSIPNGAYAKVYGATLGIGTGQINIVVGEDESSTPMAREDATMRGEMASMLNEIITPSMVQSFQRTLDGIGNLAIAMEPVAGSLEDLLAQRSVAEVDDPKPGDDAPLSNISTVIERIDTLVAHLNAVLGDVDVQEDVRTAVHDLKEAASSIRQLLESWKEKSTQLADTATGAIDRTEQKIDGSIKLLDHFLAQVGQAATGLVHLIADIEQGRGTAGLIAKDERLYESAVLALERLNVVLADLAIISGKIRDDGHFEIVVETRQGVPYYKESRETPGGSKADREAKMAAQP